MNYINRRGLLRFFAAYALASSACLCRTMQAEALTGTQSCLRDRNIVRSLNLLAKAPDSITKRAAPSQRSIILNSENESFDRSLGRNVLQPLSDYLGVRPGFGYYDEKELGEMPNAIATEENLFRESESGTVIFGLELLTGMMSRQNGGSGVLTVCAHEFGHMRQFKDGYVSEILENFPPYCIELHADFIAGYYLRAHFERFPGTKLQPVIREWRLLPDKGKASHGTILQRVHALDKGYAAASNSRKHSVSEAMVLGMDHIRKIT